MGEDHVSQEGAENAGDSTILTHVHTYGASDSAAGEKEREGKRERRRHCAESRYRLVTGNSSVGSSSSER